MNKLYFIGDSHISKQLYVNRPTIINDSYNALESIVTQIIEESEGNNQAVIFAGDNFNTKTPTAEDLGFFHKQVGRLKEVGVAVYGIDGNHDKTLPVSWLELVGVTKSEYIIDILGFKILMLDYIAGPGIYTKMEELQDVECDFLVLHQAFSHISPFEANALNMEDIPPGVKNVVFGHIHMESIKKNSNNTSIVSIGSIHARGRMDHQGTFVSYCNGNFKHINPSYNRTMLKYTCDSLSDVEAMIGLFKDLPKQHVDKQPIVSVIIKRSLVEHITQFEDLSKDRCHLFTDVKLDDNVCQEIQDTTDIETKADLLTKYFKTHGLEKEKDMYGTLLELVSRRDDTSLQTILSKITKEFV